MLVPACVLLFGPVLPPPGLDAQSTLPPATQGAWPADLIIWSALSLVGVAFAVAWASIRFKEENTRRQIAQIEAQAKAGQALSKELLEARADAVLQLEEAVKAVASLGLVVAGIERPETAPEQRTTEQSK